MSNANSSVSFFEPGADVTGIATGACTGKRFAVVSGNKDVNGNYSIAQAGAAVRALGVVSHDAATGERVTIRRGFGRIQAVTAGATLAANVEVESDAQGRAVPFAAGVKLGFAMTGAANGADAEISLYI